MLELKDIPRNPDNALFYLIKMMSEEYGACFDEEGELLWEKTTPLLLIGSSIRVSAEKSEFEHSTSIASSAKQMVSLLSEDKLDFATTRNFVSYFDGVAIREKLSRRFSFAETDPVFVLKQNEIDRVLSLSSEMRELISSSEIFDEGHKIRLLNRLSSVETEIYKPEGKFDVILGGVADFGEALGLFGKSVKPLTDRMAEIRAITQERSPEYNNLPAPEKQKRLPPPDK